MRNRAIGWSLAPDVELIEPIETHTSLHAFFFESLKRALRHTATIVRPHTEWYLVEALAEHAQRAVPPDEPYAVILARSVELPAPQRVRALCELGDSTLLGLGLFPEALQRPHVSSDYFVGMGSAAYGDASQLLQASGERVDLAGALGELSLRFTRVVATLAVLGEQSLPALPSRASSRVMD